jgi:CHAT domain-containing protein/tetratricopeptide (TPR) repeat protein
MIPIGPPWRRGRRRRRRSRPLLFLIAASLLASPGTPGGTAQDGEALPPGQRRERPIAGGETHLYRVEVGEAPLLVTVEQRGIDLVIDLVGPVARFATDAGYLRWESETLLLDSPGEHRLEIHSRVAAVPRGRYMIQVETLPAVPASPAPPAITERRRAALALMSRAGRESFERTPEAQRRAAATYREALAAWRALGERRWQAESLDALAVLLAELRELRPAAEHYLQALALWRELGAPHREAATLNELGLARAYMGEIDAAREALQGALALWQRLGERFDEGETRSNLCYLDQMIGALPAALTCYEASLALFRDLGDLSQEARILNNIGGVHEGLGQPDAALDFHARALALRRRLGERREEAQTLNNVAMVHNVLGEWQEALRVYGQARQILAALGDRAREVSLLNNLGFTYNSLGEPQRALAFLQDALRLRREIGDRRGEVTTLNNLGSTWHQLGDLQQALDHHRQALDLAAALGDHRQEALTRLRLGEIQLKQGDPSVALRELEPALARLRETGLRYGELLALQLRGRALVQAGRPREALPVLADLVERQRTLRDRAGEAQVLQVLAVAERSLGLAPEARAHAEQAVARVEELRTGFVSPGLRAAFLGTQRRAYSLLIDLLMDRHAADPGGGHDRAALEVSERVRARSLLDALYSGDAVRPGGGVPAELLDRRRALRYRLSARVDQQLRRGGAGAEKTEAQERELGTLLAELDGVEAEIRRLDPHYAAVAAPPTLGVAEIARLLDPGTLLLEYSLGEDRSYLWAIGAGAWRSFVLPPEREIEALARRLHEELSTLEAGAGRRRETAEALSRILLGPVWSEAARHHRLVVVPDAALHVLPFGALPAPDSGEPLLERFEIAYLPSATTLALQRRLELRPPAAKWAAVLADPVFAPEDPRLTGPPLAGRPEAAGNRERGAPEEAPLSALERLPATRLEAEAIRALAPGGQVWTALDLAASREAVLSGELRDYRIVHFATHGLADTRNPELSGLVFSLVDAAGRPRQGFLSLSDVYELDLGADLVVLSGCRTALGREVRGEGIMGLTRGFLHAGVPRVVASLWRVQDRATAELMTRFYRALWQDLLPPAAALRAAQTSLRRDPRYRDPYSWAGFVLQGDWR